MSEKIHKNIQRKNHMITITRKIYEKNREKYLKKSF